MAARTGWFASVGRQIGLLGVLVLGFSGLAQARSLAEIQQSKEFPGVYRAYPPRACRSDPAGVGSSVPSRGRCTKRWWRLQPRWADITLKFFRVLADAQFS